MGLRREKKTKREQTKTKLRIEGSNGALTLVKSEQVAEADGHGGSIDSVQSTSQANIFNKL